MSLILIDLDGTLFTGRSAESSFVRYLLHHRLLGTRQLAALAIFPLKWSLHFGRHVLRKNKAYLTDMDVAEVSRHAERFVQQQLMDQLRPQIIRRVEWHIANGDVVALLTGTPDFIARPLARALNIKHWRATRCAARGNKFTNAPPTRHPFGRDKIDAARELCVETVNNLSDCVAYADSIHDGALFEQVGKAIAVNPDERLSQLAQHKGWEILART